MKPVEPPASNAEPSADDREIELKLGLSAAAAEKLRRLPLLRERAITPPEASRLETIYVDTPSLALFGAGVFLRVRRKGDRYVQALKTRGSVLSGIEARRESEIDLPDATVRPDLVSDPPTILRRNNICKRLAPMVTTVISRTTWLLDDVNGNRIELVLDKGRIEAGGRTAVISEVELELKRGEPAALFDMALELLDAVALRNGDASKAVRGFRLIEPEAPQPVRATGVRLDPAQSVGSAFQAIARSCLAQILANQAAALDGVDPEGVHQMRVGVRRLRSAMSVFAKALSGPETEVIARELKWFLGRLGPARDMDVFLSDILAPVVAYFSDDPAMAGLEQLAEQRRTEEYRRVSTLLKSTRFTRMSLRLGRWIEKSGWRDDDDQRSRGWELRPVVALAAKVLAKRHARLRTAGHNIEQLSVADLHRLRIQVKKQRYAVEYFRGLFPRPRTGRYLRALKHLQDSLGYLNDAAVAERLVADVLATLPRAGVKTRNARTGGTILKGWHGCKVASHRDALYESWRQFGDHKKFWK